MPTRLSDRYRKALSQYQAYEIGAQERREQFAEQRFATQEEDRQDRLAIEREKLQMLRESHEIATQRQLAQLAMQRQALQFNRLQAVQINQASKELNELNPDSLYFANQVASIAGKYPYAFRKSSNGLEQGLIAGVKARLEINNQNVKNYEKRALELGIDVHDQAFHTDEKSGIPDWKKAVTFADNRDKAFAQANNLTVTGMTPSSFGMRPKYGPKPEVLDLNKARETAASEGLTKEMIHFNEKGQPTATFSSPTEPKSPHVDPVKQASQALGVHAEAFSNQAKVRYLNEVPRVLLPGTTKEESPSGKIAEITYPNPKKPNETITREVPRADYEKYKSSVSTALQPSTQAQPTAQQKNDPMATARSIFGM